MVRRVFYKYTGVYMKKEKYVGAHKRWLLQVQPQGDGNWLEFDNGSKKAMEEKKRELLSMAKCGDCVGLTAEACVRVEPYI